MPHHVRSLRTISPCDTGSAFTSPGLLGHSPNSSQITASKTEGSADGKEHQIAFTLPPGAEAGAYAFAREPDCVRQTDQDRQGMLAGKRFSAKEAHRATQWLLLHHVKDLCRIVAFSVVPTIRCSSAEMTMQIWLAPAAIIRSTRYSETAFGRSAPFTMREPTGGQLFGTAQAANRAARTSSRYCRPDNCATSSSSISLCPNALLRYIAEAALRGPCRYVRSERPAAGHGPPWILTR